MRGDEPMTYAREAAALAALKARIRFANRRELRPLDLALTRLKISCATNLLPVFPPLETPSRCR